MRRRRRRRRRREYANVSEKPNRGRDLSSFSGLK
jgi:hypothetical protein